MFHSISSTSQRVGAFALLLCLLFSSTVFAAPGDIKWAYDTGNTQPWVSCPAIDDDGTVYVGSEDFHMYALNADGTLKWRTEMLDHKAGKRSVVIGPDGTLYLGATSGNLYAVNPADGSIKWTTKPEASTISTSVGIGADGTLYVGNYAGNLYAVNPDGSVKWTFSTGRRIYGAPTIGTDGTIYFGGADKNIHALNPDGTQKWAYTFPGEIQSSPAIGSDGTLYVGNLDYNVYALNSDGTLKWKFATGGFVLPSPVIGTDGTIYIGSKDQKFYALNSDGTLKWVYDTGFDLVDSTAAIGADGTVYVASGRGGGYLFAFTPGGSLRWRTRVTTGTEHTVSPVALAPDGTLYIQSHDGNLTAVESDSSGLADSPWPKFMKSRKNDGRKQVTLLTGSLAQAPGVTATVTGLKTQTQTATALRTSYKGLTGFTPCNDVTAFNATVTAEANATFYMESDQLNGTVSEFWLYKLKNGDSLPFDGYSPTHGNYTNGIWWITDGTDSVQNKSAILTKGTTYRIYFCIKDNGQFDLNSTKGFIYDPVVLGRSSISPGPTQPAGVITAVNNAARKEALPGDMTIYGAHSSFQPMADFASFNATVSPSNSTGVFRFNSTSLSGPIEDLKLLKLFESNFSVREYGQYAPSDINSTDGAWWLTYRNNTYIPFNATLTQGINYFVNFVVQDNGPYDADPTLGAITDPVALGTPTAGSSSGCMLNPVAGFGLEWLMVMLIPVVGTVRIRFRK